MSAQRYKVREAALAELDHCCSVMLTRYCSCHFLKIIFKSYLIILPTFVQMDAKMQCTTLKQSENGVCRSNAILVT